MEEIYIYFSLDIYACSSSTMWFPFIATEKNTKVLSVGNNVTHVIEDQHAYYIYISLDIYMFIFDDMGWHGSHLLLPKINIGEIFDIDASWLTSNNDAVKMAFSLAINGNHTVEEHYCFLII